MTGRILAALLVLPALVLGALMYWLQVYAYYEELDAEAAGGVTLVSLQSGEPEPIPYADFRAIDATSSPIRFRACFTTPMRPAELAGKYAPAPKAAPRNAPGWFDCFDAEAIGRALEEGRARAFLGVGNIHYGVDRIVAITEDGRGYVWHDLNDCGKTAYDGTPLDPTCPEPEGR